jgi:hypothetical protein
MGYTNEPFMRSEHLLRGGKYASPTCKVSAVLTGVPLMRKNKSYQGIALQFEGQTKVLGLGVTNESIMAVVAGDSNPQAWIGVAVKIEVREVNSASGGTEPAIRIIPPAGTKMRSGLVRQLGKKIEYSVDTEKPPT